MERDSELALVDRLRQGDTVAFDAVYAEFHRPLYNFLARLSRSRDVAEDLLEETWLRLVGHARRLAPDTRLKPWLFTVARNLYASYCRSRALDESLAANVLGLWPVSRPEPSPFEQAAADELERRVEHALAGLPSTYREALLLVAAGFTSPEAAEVCGTSAEAMRQRLSRARATVTRQMARARSELKRASTTSEPRERSGA